MTEALPILYSFRRCPYAMRARLALASAGVSVKLREVVLRDKPTSMLEASPKGTVPVIIEPGGGVIDESLDVMLWALGRNDPEEWLKPGAGTMADMRDLIALNDGDFKHHLDRFKYATRYEDADPEEHRAGAEKFLHLLEAKLSENPWLFGARASLADYAILPFVRQFAGAAKDWWQGAPYPHVQTWLDGFKTSERFKAVMRKYPQWHEGDEEPVFPAT
ncbi:glutathione S-transferase [Kordiimonas sp.]|uniref:glutathione S-transferase n=1 Tax=Kordiimonas sp. TaxID=1970157 RepID=UPI003A8CDDD7